MDAYNQQINELNYIQRKKTHFEMNSEIQF